MNWVGCVVLWVNEGIEIDKNEDFFKIPSREYLHIVIGFIGKLHLLYEREKGGKALHFPHCLGLEESCEFQDTFYLSPQLVSIRYDSFDDDAAIRIDEKVNLVF